MARLCVQSGVRNRLAGLQHIFCNRTVSVRAGVEDWVNINVVTSWL